MTPPHNREETLHDSALTFVSVIYAASVHSFVVDARDAHGVPLISALVTAALIIFIFSDWASRSRLPRLLPETLSPVRTLIKVLLEIMGVYFLVTSFLSLVVLSRTGDPQNKLGQLSAPGAFAIFLFVTWVWDLLMLGVMRDLTWRGLMSASALGTVMDLDEVRQKYLARFNRYWEKRQAEARKWEDETMGVAKEERESLGPLIKMLTRRSNAVAFTALVRLFIQYLANHTAWANLIAAGVIVADEDLHKGKPLLPVAGSIVTYIAETVPQLQIAWIVLVIIALVATFSGRRRAAWLAAGLIIVGFIVATTTLFAARSIAWLTLLVTLIVVDAIPFTQKNRLPRAIGGVMAIATFLFIYTSIPPLWIVVLLAVQQVLANIFLQLAVESPQKPPSTSVVLATPIDSQATGA